MTTREGDVSVRGDLIHKNYVNLSDSRFAICYLGKKPISFIKLSGCRFGWSD